MTIAAQLNERMRARGEWIGRGVARWEKDPRVAGAWLWGSDGRGSTDALSDIDLFVVFVDQCAHECLAEVEDWFTDCGTVLWSREVPHNAPAEGRYFSVGYPAPALPLAIDWYWQPASAAKVGTDTRVLLEKQPLPVSRRGPSSSSRM